MVEKEREKELGLFDKKQWKNKIDIKNITAFDCYENFVLIGDDKGYLFSYDLNEKTFECLSDHQVEVNKGYKIEGIKCHSSINVAYVISNGSAYIYSIPKLEKYHKSDVKDIVKYSVNNHHSRSNEIVFVTKKKKLKFMEYSHEMRKLIESKMQECYAPDIPDIIDWHKDWMCLLTKKKCVLINTSGKIVNIDFEGITNAKSIGSSWLMYMGGTGVFMDKNGPKPQNTIDFGNKLLISICNYNNNFVISLHESVLKVFDSRDSSNIQDVLIDHGLNAKFISINQGRIIYLCHNISNNTYGVFELKELAYEKQISKLLNEEKFEDALIILNNKTSSSSEDKPKKLEQFFLDCAWVCLVKGNFKKAIFNFKLSNYNPLSLIFLFQNDLKTLLKQEEVKNYINAQKVSIEEITANNHELIKDAMINLCELLTEKISYFQTSFLQFYSGGDFNKALESNVKVEFSESEHSLLNLSKFNFTFKDVLIIMNTAIVKLMILIKCTHSKIKKIVESDHFYWNEEDLNIFLNNCDNSIEAKITQAYILEKTSKWEGALRIWQEFGNKKEEDRPLSQEACDRTLAILNLTKDKELFKEFIVWMISKYTTQAFEIFINTELIPTEYFYTSIIGMIDKTNPSLNLKERFLEFYLDSGCTNERYHTMICELYIDKLFKLRKNESEYIESSALDEASKYIYDKLYNIIMKTKYYSKVHILEKIKDSWLVDITVYLYSQLNMNNDAINKLIEIGSYYDNFDKVEKFCNDTNSLTLKTDMFSTMFKILCQNYKMSKDSYNNLKLDNETQKLSYQKQAEIYKNQIYLILNKYGDSQFLDVFVVLENLPDDWMLTEQKLYEYLVKVIKTTNHMSNKYKLAKSLSEMNVLYKEKELIEAKSKSVCIGNDTNCEYCNKKIGSTIFVVYPNMKVYHTKCAQNSSVCPVTRVDFTKVKY